MKNNVTFFSLLIFCLLSSCYGVDKEKIKDNIRKDNGKIITDAVVQDSLFRNLERLTFNSIPADKLEDSLIFLLLPVKASCPACRKKTIDSIVKYKSRLDDSHFVVISGNGMKSIDGYFEEQKKETPLGSGIYYDTLGVAADLNMTTTNPNVYYSARGKVYRKVSCLPSSIKKDLSSFFSGL